MKTGIKLIAKERQRQIKAEGWTSEHDDTHTSGELALAGAYYAIHDLRHAFWPWNWDWCKTTPKNKIRDLEKAGALIAAEIDRLLRIKEQEEKK